MDVPRHIGIILDGNRRYGEEKLKNRLKGHADGAKKVENVISWAKEIGIKELTLYCFSTKNFNRTPKEIETLFNLFRKWFQKIKDKNNNVKLNFIGKLDMFPDDLQVIMQELMEKTKDNNEGIVNFAMGYDGRVEIIDAVKKICKDCVEGKMKINNVNEQKFENYLYLKSKPDLLIRTSGEKRISGFLLWQCSYAELFFIEKNWPEFSKEDLLNIIEEYNQRNRRFGK